MAFLAEHCFAPRIEIRCVNIKTTIKIQQHGRTDGKQLEELLHKVMCNFKL